MAELRVERLARLGIAPGVAMPLTKRQEQMPLRPRHHSRPRGALLAFVALLLVALCTASCAEPQTPASAQGSTATESPLARTVIYWSAGTLLLALRSDDGRERWRAGNWTWPIPGDGGNVVFGPADPVAENGTLFATSNADHTGIPTAYAFNPTDGTTRWRTPLAGCIAHPGAPPLAVDGVLYVALTGHSSNNIECGPSGWVFALREADGAVLWRKPFADVVSPSLALTNGVLVVLSDSYPAEPETLYLTGLRSDDGTQLWQIHRDAQASEVFAAADGVIALSRTLRTGYTDQWTTYVEAFRVTDGARLWQMEPAVHFGGAVATVAHGLVYVHSDLGYLYALRIADGSTAWRFQTGVTFIGAPALVGGSLYFGSGPRLLELDAASGTLVRAYSPLGSPTGAADSDLHAWKRPLLTGGALFVAGAALSGGWQSHPVGTLFALDLASGQVLWQQSSRPDASYSTPVAIVLPVAG